MQAGGTALLSFYSTEQEALEAGSHLLLPITLFSPTSVAQIAQGPCLYSSSRLQMPEISVTKITPLVSAATPIAHSMYKVHPEKKKNHSARKTIPGTE